MSDRESLDELYKDLENGLDDLEELGEANDVEFLKSKIMIVLERINIQELNEKDHLLEVLGLALETCHILSTQQYKCYFVLKILEQNLFTKVKPWYFEEAIEHLRCLRFFDNLAQAVTRFQCNVQELCAVVSFAAAVGDLEVGNFTCVLSNNAFKILLRLTPQNLRIQR